VSSSRIQPFLSSRWVDAPDGVDEKLDPNELTSGFRAAGVAAGIKADGGTDVGLLVCDADEVRSSLALTANASAAAPVRVCRELCDADSIRGLVVNSGNANASTGRQGYADAVAMRDAAAGAVGLEPAQVAVGETGVIGVPLQVETVIEGVRSAAAELSPFGAESFTRSLMTTDRGPKMCALELDGVSVTAQAKGAGMIEPGFATMLCFVQTDAEVPDPDEALRRALAGSMERITVDGQMSTNDMVLLQATGGSGKPMPEGLLEAVLLQLALEIVADGEGATRVGRARVRQAASAEEAERVARAIANSPLVKTALFGKDPNWGRIAQAAGMALAGEELKELGPDRIDAKELAGDDPEAELTVSLGRGDAEAHVYFSDLTYDYVRINAEYTT
jgi:glutamate N-acetyltransferase / amino-acid N-acetyltransferase